MTKEKTNKPPKGPAYVTFQLDREAALMLFELASKAAAVGSDARILSRLYDGVEKAVRVYSE